MNTIKTIFSQTSWQIAGKVITSLSTLLILSLIARKYGEYGTGIYTLALTYLSLFFLFSDLGLNAYVLPLFGKDKLLTQFQKLLGFRILIALGLIILALVCIPLASKNLVFASTVKGGVVTILFYAIFITVTALFQYKQSYNRVTTATFVATLASLAVFMIFFLSAGVTLPTFIYSQVVYWAMIALMGVLLIRKFIRFPTPLLDLGYIKEVLKNAWPISLTLLLNTLYFRIDSFLIEYFQGFNAVGIYNVSYTLFQATLVLPAYVTNSYYPIMITELQKNREKFIRDLKVMTGGLFLLGVGGLAVTLVVGQLILSWVVGGQNFAGSYPALVLLFTGLPAYFATSILMWALFSMKKQRIVLLIYSLGLIINILLNLILIPSLSFLGAAIATSISEYLILVFQLFILYSLLKKS